MSITLAKKQQKHYSEKEPWEKRIDNFDRAQRRREDQWRKHVVRIDAALMSQLTDNSGRLILDKINNLEPEAE